MKDWEVFKKANEYCRNHYCGSCIFDNTDAHESCLMELKDLTQERFYKIKQILEGYEEEEEKKKKSFWLTVPVDTKVIVTKENHNLPRYFAYCRKTIDNIFVYVWAGGATEFSAKGLVECYDVSEVELYEEQSEVDWSSVEVDALVTVKYGAKKILRHFAKYEDCKVYVYSCGADSLTGNADEFIVAYDEEIVSLGDNR